MKRSLTVCFDNNVSNCSYGYILVYFPYNLNKIICYWERDSLFIYEIELVEYIQVKLFFRFSIFGGFSMNLAEDICQVNSDF